MCSFKSEGSSTVPKKRILYVFGQNHDFPPARQKTQIPARAYRHIARGNLEEKKLFKELPAYLTER